MFDDVFLLKCGKARILLHDIAKKAPIYDYHCHLSTKEIHEDTPALVSKRFLRRIS